MPGASLTLISHPLCPFVQRATIVLLDNGVPFNRIDVDLAAKPGWFLALSPTGKVPLLKVSQADGPDAVLFESMVICEYLEESQNGAGLYPVDALSRARQRGWIEFGTATLAAVSSRRVGRRWRRDRASSSPWRETMPSGSGSTSVSIRRLLQTKWNALLWLDMA